MRLESSYVLADNDSRMRPHDLQRLQKERVYQQLRRSLLFTVSLASGAVQGRMAKPSPVLICEPNTVALYLFQNGLFLFGTIRGVSPLKLSHE